VLYVFTFVSCEAVKNSVALSTPLNTLRQWILCLILKYLQSSLKMLGGVCKSGVEAQIAYFVWLWLLFVVHFTPEL